MAKQKMMNVSISEARKERHTALSNLATKLNCRMSDLVWEGVSLLLANPPAVAPEGSSTSLGTSTGIWVVHTLSDKGRVEGIGLVDGIRSKTSGRIFFRYDAAKPETKERAIKQAQRAAAYDCQITGIDFPDEGLPIAVAE